jgi:arsenical pump membrane protein
MSDIALSTTLTVFSLTVLFLIWRPGGLHESVPTAIGAGVLIACGIVPLSQLLPILQMVGTASVTFLCTIVMSLVLESIGFFRWSAYNVIRQAKGSGIRLFWWIILLCFIMTLFFNHDGSILITTPIIIQIVTLLNLKNHQKVPFLLSGALIAIASSAPIGTSNLVNLFAMNIVGLNLNTYANLMFVPSMLGIGMITLLLFLYFRRTIPSRITLFLPPDSSPFPDSIPHAYYNPKTVDRWIHKGDNAALTVFHPLMGDKQTVTSIDWGLFRICITIVVLVRASYYGGAQFGIPIVYFAIAGALLLIAVRWGRTGEGPVDTFQKTPWPILLFAFSIYVIVYSLHHTGLTAALVNVVKPYIVANDFQAVMIVGLLLTVMSSFLNNLPSVMIGTMSLTEMGLDPGTLQIAYLANIIGSDIGSLLTPIGTLATVLWIYLLRKNNIPMSWKQYMKVTIIVIPISLVFSLLCLFFWTRWLIG